MKVKIKIDENQRINKTEERTSEIEKKSEIEPVKPKTKYDRRVLTACGGNNNCKRDA